MVYAPPPMVQAAAPIAHPTAAALALGRELGDLLNGVDVFHIQTKKLFEQTMPEQLRAQPAFASAEQHYPGIIRYFVEQLRPVVERQTIARIPALLDRLGALYAANLTEAQLRETLEFYRSPAGRDLIRRVAEGWDLGQILGQSIQNPDHAIKDAALSGAMMGAAATGIADMPEDYRSALFRFSMSPTGLRVASVNRQIVSITAEWANSPPDADKQEVAELSVKAIRDYIGQYDAAHPSAPEPAKPEAKPGG